MFSTVHRVVSYHHASGRDTLAKSGWMPGQNWAQGSVEHQQNQIGNPAPVDIQTLPGAM